MIERIRRSKAAADEGGFTLIELLVVIIILGILAAVVVFAVGGVGDKGQGAACKIDTRTMRTAAEAHFAQKGTYGVTPANWDGVTPAPPAGGARTVLDETVLTTGGFLSEISTYHNISIYDGNADAAATPPSPAGTITPAVEITVADVRCGTVGAPVNGTSNL